MASDFEEPGVSLKRYPGTQRVFSKLAATNPEPKTISSTRIFWLFLALRVLKSGKFLITAPAIVYPACCETIRLEWRPVCRMPMNKE
jgi:hypothetical protein